VKRPKKLARRAQAAMPEPRKAEPRAQQRAEIAALKERLAQAIAQQTATAEVLQVISALAGGLSPVFTAILQRAVRLCGAIFGVIYRFDGELIHIVAHHNFTPQALAILQAAFPSPPGPSTVTSRAILEAQNRRDRGRR
jgi:two-component system, NtrC family, sensor kinase